MYSYALAAGGGALFAVLIGSHHWWSLTLHDVALFRRAMHGDPIHRLEHEQASPLRKAQAQRSRI
jgi:hypothetical protein